MPNSEVILSYPDNYIVHVCTSKGINIFIRPLLQTDLASLTEFFRSLSARSVYYRFMEPIAEFSEKMLSRLIQVDHKNSIALAAFDEKESHDIILGIARLYVSKDLFDAEISIVVIDKLQGKGIGAELFQRCIDIGESMGVGKIWGLVLAENIQMIKLARKLNFEVTLEPVSHEYFISRNFK